MALGMEVGLDPGHIMLDGDPAPNPQKGVITPNFWLMSIVAKRLVDQDSTWYGVGLGPGHVVLDGDPAPPQKGGTATPIFGQCLSYGGRPRLRWGPSSPPKRGTALPHFSAHVYCGQTAGWIKTPLGTKVGLSPGHIVLHGDPAPPKRGTHTPNFRPMSIVGKRSPMALVYHC